VLDGVFKLFDWDIHRFDGAEDIDKLEIDKGDAVFCGLPEHFSS
jgi:hypothetical protein